MAKVGDGTPGPGRPKGSPNKTTALLKDAIIQAAERAGNKVSEDGQGGLISYLEQQAAANPGPFMSLLSKVLPMQIEGEMKHGAADSLTSLLAQIAENGRKITDR